MNAGMQSSRNPRPIQEKRVTRWKNPTDRTITAAIVEDGEVFHFTVPAGEERDLDGKYDRAIHQVDCGRDDCHRHGWWCTAGHEGTVSGGLAPLLRRVGKNDKLDPMLDPDVQAQKSIDASLRSAAVMGAVQKQAVMAAAEKMTQTGAPSAPAPAAQAPTRK